MTELTSTEKHRIVAHFPEKISKAIVNLCYRCSTDFEPISLHAASWRLSIRVLYPLSKRISDRKTETWRRNGL